MARGGRGIASASAIDEKHEHSTGRSSGSRTRSNETCTNTPRSASARRSDFVVLGNDDPQADAVRRKTEVASR